MEKRVAKSSGPAVRNVEPRIHWNERMQTVPPSGRTHSLSRATGKNRALIFVIEVNAFRTLHRRGEYAEIQQYRFIQYAYTSLCRG